MIQRVKSLAELVLPNDAVVVADASLPGWLLESFEAPILVEAGESLKTLGRLEALAEEVLERRSSRPLTLVAVGGGSVGDAVGFLASVLWRGVSLWHVPTTLLAMVDSAHGGKTAVNLGLAKNQLGTFYVAQRVVLVEEILAGLPFAMREDGLAELVKGLWLGDAAALDLLDAEGGVGALARGSFEVVGERLMTLLERAIAVKLDVVARDPFEKEGVRTILNLGHTAAHALELALGLTHGQAVAWGLLAAAHLSHERGGLAAEAAQRLYEQVVPLLRYEGALFGEGLEEAVFVQLLERDKKRVDGRLRSVLLRGAGEPFVTGEVTAADWYRAFAESLQAWKHGALTVSFAPERSGKLPVRLDISASKSELNRLLVIAYLRPGKTEVLGESSCDDVVAMRNGLAALRAAGDDFAALDCGLGGTTFRFLLAVAAARPEPTRLYAAKRLLERPQHDLVKALRQAGAEIEPFAEDENGQGFEVRGWDVWPEGFVVSAEQSSQFASALALLSASGRKFWLEITDEMVSEPYFVMTLELLRQAGVSCEVQGRRCWFAPTPALYEPCTLAAAVDASSAAVWAVAAYLRPAFAETIVLERVSSAQKSLQPDIAIHGFLERLRAADQISATNAEAPEVAFDLSACPDLGPVLVVAALGSPCAVRIYGAEHLRHKESNRIEEFVESLRLVGITVEATADGFYVPAGVQRARSGERWKSWGDHRLAMAGLLLTLGGASLILEDPWVVAKSYPELFSHSLSLGWAVGRRS